MGHAEDIERLLQLRAAREAIEREEAEVLNRLAIWASIDDPLGAVRVLANNVHNSIRALMNDVRIRPISDLPATLSLPECDPQAEISGIKTPDVGGLRLIVNNAINEEGQSAS